jgi:signal transduction histidine kinase
MIMGNRRNYVVDKRFQYRITIKIVILIMFILSIVTIGVGIHATRINDSLALTVSRLGDTMVDQEHMIYALREYPGYSSEADKKIASKILSGNIDANITLMKENVKRIEGMISMNRRIIIGILVFFLFQGIATYIYILKKTSSLSGPVFVMNRHIRRILDGEDSEIRSLRKNDEFKELYDSLTELSERYRSMKGK